MINCPKCGALNNETDAVCYHCQSPLAAQSGYQSPGGYQPIQPSYAAPPARSWQEMGADKKLAAGLCGILLGGFGIHKFILGYQTEGIIMLAACIVGGILTCGIASAAVGVIGLI